MALPVLVLLRNNLHLTRRCLASVQAQDIEVLPWLIDNASTDGTPQWAVTQRGVVYQYMAERISVAAAWNRGLSLLFERLNYECVLVLNNDTELRPDTCRYLIEDGGGFVTAVGVRHWPVRIDVPPDPARKRPHPDFSCFLISRSVWERVGPFDERFEVGYCEDADMHLRMHRAEIEAYCIDLPFLHVGAGTLKYAEPSEVRKIQIQAEKNRAYFRTKWGVGVGSKEYYDLFGTSAPPDDSSV